jgi:soluble lytic murein transglycosylase-like protein
MPTVPILNDNQQTLRPLTGERFRAPDIGEAGRTMGAGLQRLGGALSEAAETERHIDTIYAEGRAKQLDNEYQQFERDILFGEDGYYMRQNADALNARAGTEEAIRRKQAELLARAQDDLERNMLTDVFQRRSDEALTGIARYAQGQARSYASLQSSARIENAQENIVRFVDDPERVAANRATILSEVTALADINGWTDPEIIASKREEALSGAHVAVVQALMLGDAAKAAAYLERNRAEISPGELLQLDNTLLPLLADHDARGFADMAEAFEAPLAQPVIENAPDMPPGSPQQSGDGSAVWQRMIRQESGGRQLDSGGRPLTSSAGAIGIAQVMPDTAREMARELGLPWDENRYRTDPAYNEHLGRAYFAKMLRTFGGDVRKAVAAYNAGPGNPQRGRAGVRGAMRAGGENWEAHLPAETRDYLGKVLGANGGVAVARSGPSAETQAAGDLASQLEWAETFIPERLAGKPPRYIEMVVERTQAEIRQRFETRMIGVRAQNEALREEAYEQVFALGDGFTSITQISGYQTLPVELRMQLDGWADANRAAQLEASRTSDDGFFAGASDAYASDPNAFLAIPIEEARRKLDDSDFETFVGWRREALQDKREGSTNAKRVTARDVMNIAATSLASAGLSTTGVEGRKRQDIAAQQGQFQSAMMRWVESYRRVHGKEPSDEEVRVKADKFLIEMSWETSGIWNTRTSGFAFEAPANELDTTRGGTARIEVPASVRDQIMREFPGSSDAQVRQIYVRYKGRYW